MLASATPAEELTDVEISARNLELSLRAADAFEGEAGSKNTRLGRRADSLKTDLLETAQKLHPALPPPVKEVPRNGACPLRNPGPSPRLALEKAESDLAALPRVLVAAHPAKLRHALCEALAALGCVVDAEEKGSLARRRLREVTYDLAVFGSKMAGNLGGMRCAEEHRAWEAAGGRPRQRIAVVKRRPPSKALRARARKGGVDVVPGLEEVAKLLAGGG